MNSCCPQEDWRPNGQCGHVLSRNAKEVRDELTWIPANGVADS
jgi:hypothetical protein